MTGSRENPEIWKEIGGRIRSFRRSQNMSVDKLAAKVNVSRQQIVRLEAGLVGTTIERLRLLAEALGVSEADLLAPRLEPDGDALQIAFRGRGLSPEEVQKVLEYISLLESARQRE